ncbi:hypothetical protein D9M70_564800 [compost metagenome]
MPFAKFHQSLGIIEEMLVSLIADGDAVAPTRIEDFAAPALFLCNDPGKADGRPADLDCLAALCSRVPAVVFGGDLVRQVDDETGVSSRRRLPDDTGLKDGDMECRVEFHDPA